MRENKLSEDLDLEVTKTDEATSAINVFYKKHKNQIALLSSKNVVKTLLQLEGFERSYYTGIFGVCPSGDRLESAVIIRTLFLDMASLNGWMGVGCGITADSDPEYEWKEINDKVSSILGQWHIPL